MTNCKLPIFSHTAHLDRGSHHQILLTNVYSIDELEQPQPEQFLFAVFALFSFFNSLLMISPPLLDKATHRCALLNALHPPLTYALDIISRFAAPPPNNMSPARHGRIISKCSICWSVIVASVVGSWFGVSLGLGLRKEAVSLRGFP